jgi:hypothetical protein
MLCSKHYSIPYTHLSLHSIAIKAPFGVKSDFIDEENEILITFVSGSRSHGSYICECVV